MFCDHDVPFLSVWLKRLLRAMSMLWCSAAAPSVRESFSEASPLFFR